MKAEVTHLSSCFPEVLHFKNRMKSKACPFYSQDLFLEWGWNKVIPLSRIDVLESSKCLMHRLALVTEKSSALYHHNHWNYTRPVRTHFNAFFIWNLHMGITIHNYNSMKLFIWVNLLSVFAIHRVEQKRFCWGLNP